MLHYIQTLFKSSSPHTTFHSNIVTNMLGSATCINQLKKGFNPLSKISPLSLKAGPIGNLTLHISIKNVFMQKVLERNFPRFFLPIFSEIFIRFFVNALWKTLFCQIRSYRFLEKGLHANFSVFWSEKRVLFKISSFSKVKRNLPYCVFKSSKFKCTKNLNRLFSSRGLWSGKKIKKKYFKLSFFHSWKNETQPDKLDYIMLYKCLTPLWTIMQVYILAYLIAMRRFCKALKKLNSTLKIYLPYDQEYFLAYYGL